MLKDGKIYIGKSGNEEVYIYPKMANRHGLIAGATGTGKTVSLRVMAESFSDMGVPVFLADMKGDLASIALEGQDNENIRSRVESMDLLKDGYEFKSYPVNFWDVYGEKGMPLRTTVSEMGPLLLSRIMGLNDTQTDILNIIFQIADKEGLLLIDTKDLKAMIQYVSEKAKEYSLEYGNIAPVSLAAITRGVVAMEADGADLFFGEPALDIQDWMKTDKDGRGMIQVLDAQKLGLNAKMYSIFLLWLMSELFETLPEVGDLDKPKMVFFFDEAHMLFDNANKVLLEKIEQVVKLIRSKGVGIYFITQNPKDIPDGVLAQLGNKVQHALRAYTPKEQEGARAAAKSFRENPAFNTFDALQTLGTGEALVSVLGLDGIPSVVCQTTILPPQSQLGALSETTRQSFMNNCNLYDKYAEYVDNDSAYEFMQRRNLQLQEEAEAAEAEKQAAKEQAAADKAAAKEAEKKAKAEEKAKAAKGKAVKSATQSVASTTAGTIGREIGKTIGSAGGKFGKTLGGNIGASLGRGIIGTLFKLK